MQHSSVAKDPVGEQVLDPTPKPLALAVSFPAQEVRSGVINSRPTPVSSVKPMETVSIPQPLKRRHELSKHPSEMVQMYQREENAVLAELIEVRQEIDTVKALLFRRQELIDWLEELTGAEKPDGLLESPKVGAC